MGTMTIDEVGTVLAPKQGVDSEGRYWEGLIGFSSSYATGGDTLDLAEIALKTVEQVWIDISSGTGSFDTSGMSVEVDLTDPEVPLVLLYTGSATEATNGSNQILASGRARIYGKS